jgi:hypothetical protein
VASIGPTLDQASLVIRRHPTSERGTRPLVAWVQLTRTQIRKRFQTRQLTLTLLCSGPEGQTKMERANDTPSTLRSVCSSTTACHRLRCHPSPCMLLSLRFSSSFESYLRNHSLMAVNTGDFHFSDAIVLILYQAQADPNRWDSSFAVSGV